MRKLIFILTGAGFGIHILFWVAVIGGGIYFASDVIAFLDGALSRLDHLIGYAGGDP